MYYGNPTAVNQENPEGVWDSNFLAVHHLEETSGTHYDSTVNHHDGTPHGALNQNAIGMIDGADEFDGVNDHITLSQVFSTETQFSMEAWIYPQAGARYFVSQWNNNAGAFIQVSAPGTSIEWYINGTSAGSTSITLDTWHYIVGTYNGTTANLYKNLNTPVSKLHDIPTWPSEGTYIGDRSDGTRQFHGIIDEVRFSDIARSSSWIYTSYNNQNDPRNFSSVGPEETLSEAPVVSNEYPRNNTLDVSPTLSTLQFDLSDPQGDLMNYTVTTSPDIGSATITGVYDGTYTVPISGLTYSTTYSWSVKATDGTHWTNVSYTFTTQAEPVNDPPVFSNPYPANGSTGVSKSLPSLSITIQDPEGDLFNWTITTSPNIGSNSGLGADNGTKTCLISGLVNYTTYTWSVTATDGTSWTNKTYTFTTQASTILLLDSEFNNNNDSDDLRANSTSQDWYESRGGFPGGDPSLLTLDTNAIGLNTGKKAGLLSYGASTTQNAYLTQEFSSLQFGTFNVSFDIYIDRIEDNANYDRTGHIYIGNDDITTNAPTGTSNERFVMLAFYDPTPGDAGDDLELRARTTSSQDWATTSSWTLIASGLSYDEWLTIRLDVKVASGTYDVFINGVLQMADVPKYQGYTSPSVLYMSFTADGDGRGDFYVDNVYAPAMQRYHLEVTTIGNGTVTAAPAESTYIPGTTVTLTAVPDPGWGFISWTGDLTSTSNPDDLLMDTDKTVTATFSTTMDLHITNLTGQWNFISIPYSNTINTTALTIRSGGTDYTWTNATLAGIILGFIYDWNRTTQSYQLTDTLHPGHGYWLYAYTACELWAQNLPVLPPDTNITLLALQWNVIGIPFNDPVEQDNLLIWYNGTAYNWSQATTTSNPTGSPLILGFLYNWTRPSQAYTLSPTLQPGYAYWMYAYKSCILKKGV
jgi:hypothetical protein